MIHKIIKCSNAVLIQKYLVFYAKFTFAAVLPWLSGYRKITRRLILIWFSISDWPILSKSILYTLERIHYLICFWWHILMKFHKHIFWPSIGHLITIQYIKNLNLKWSDYIVWLLLKRFGAIAQLVEHLHGMKLLKVLIRLDIN